MTRLWQLIVPIATAMALMGFLWGLQGFFGGEPSRPVSQLMFDLRWYLILEGLAGVVLLFMAGRHANRE